MRKVLVTSTVVLGAAVLGVAVQSGMAGATGPTATGSGDAYTACVREHGVPDFPGLTVDDNGKVHLVNGANPFAAEYRAAAEECAGSLPEGASLPAAPPEPSLPFACTGDCPVPPVVIR